MSSPGAAVERVVAGLVFQGSAGLVAAVERVVAVAAIEDVVAALAHQGVVVAGAGDRLADRILTRLVALDLGVGGVVVGEGEGIARGVDDRVLDAVDVEERTPALSAPPRSRPPFVPGIDSPSSSVKLKMATGFLWNSPVTVTPSNTTVPMFGAPALGGTLALPLLT